MVNNLIAEETILGNPLSGIGNIGNASTDSPGTLAKILSTVIGLLTVVGVLYFLFIFITGAIGIISSGGDKGAYEDARKKITTGFLGLVVVVAAIFIMDVVSLLLGIPDILNVANTIEIIRNP